MRTEASIKNSIFATVSMIIKIFIGFLAQKIFVLILNAEYLGANGLFSNVMTLLTLAELGIGQSIIFNMYKPIADNDKETIKSLMELYRKAYNIIALTVLVIGCALIPFLDLFIGETSLDLNFTFVYILFLLQSVISYLLTYKRSILYAYQENYIISIVGMVYIIFSNIVQLSILFVSKNYYLYLITKTICSLLENIIISNIANKKYEFLKEKNIQKLDKKIERDIFTRIKAIFFHKIGTVVVTGTDNIIISKFFGLATVGIYSNYYMIIYYVGEIIHQMIASLIPSVGNLLTEKNNVKSLEIYRKIRFLNFWLAVFSATSILVIAQSFIKLWMGEEFLLNFGVVIVLVLNYYLKMMRQTNDVFVSAAGICVETKFVPIIESILNIIFSIILLKPFGLAGVFMGTIISSIALWGYTYPKFVYKNIFDGKYSDYIKENLIYILVFLLIATITYTTTMLFIGLNLWLDIILRITLCMLIPNVLLLIFYKNTEEFKYFKSLVGIILEKRIKKVEKS